MNKPEEKITLKEFRAWLDGLLAGRDMEREALPTRDQWAKILAKIAAIHDYDAPMLYADHFGKHIGVSGIKPVYIGPSPNTCEKPEYHGYADTAKPGVVYISAGTDFCSWGVGESDSLSKAIATVQTQVIDQNELFMKACDEVQRKNILWSDG